MERRKIWERDALAFDKAIDETSDSTEMEQNKVIVADKICEDDLDEISIYEELENDKSDDSFPEIDDDNLEGCPKITVLQLDDISYDGSFDEDAELAGEGLLTVPKESEEDQLSLHEELEFALSKFSSSDDEDGSEQGAENANINFFVDTMQSYSVCDYDSSEDSFDLGPPCSLNLQPIEEEGERLSLYDEMEQAEDEEILSTYEDAQRIFERHVSVGDRSGDTVVKDKVRENADSFVKEGEKLPEGDNNTSRLKDDVIITALRKEKRTPLSRDTKPRRGKSAQCSITKQESNQEHQSFIDFTEKTNKKLCGRNASCDLRRAQFKTSKDSRSGQSLPVGILSSNIVDNCAYFFSSAEELSDNSLTERRISKCVTISTDKNPAMTGQVLNFVDCGPFKESFGGHFHDISTNSIKLDDESVDLKMASAEAVRMRLVRSLATERTSDLTYSDEEGEGGRLGLEGEGMSASASLSAGMVESSEMSTSGVVNSLSTSQTGDSLAPTVFTWDEDANNTPYLLDTPDAQLDSVNVSTLNIDPNAEKLLASTAGEGKLPPSTTFCDKGDAGLLEVSSKQLSSLLNVGRGDSNENQPKHDIFPEDEKEPLDTDNHNYSFLSTFENKATAERKLTACNEIGQRAVQLRKGNSDASTLTPSAEVKTRIVDSSLVPFANPLESVEEIDRGGYNTKPSDNLLQLEKGAADIEPRDSRIYSSASTVTETVGVDSRTAVTQPPIYDSPIVDVRTLSEFAQVCRDLSEANTPTSGVGAAMPPGSECLVGLSKPVPTSYHPPPPPVERMKRSPAVMGVSKLFDKTDEELKTIMLSERQSRVIINDDYMYPDSVTPSKVEHLSPEDYDVPYIDDEAFYYEDWYVTDDMRLSWLDRAQIADIDECTMNSEEVTRCSTPQEIEVTANHNATTTDGKVIGGSSNRRRRSRRFFDLCGCMGRRRR